MKFEIVVRDEAMQDSKGDVMLSRVPLTFCINEKAACRDDEVHSQGTVPIIIA